MKQTTIMSVNYRRSVSQRVFINDIPPKKLPRAKYDYFLCTQLLDDHANTMDGDNW